jgi:hypothetical protein
MPKPGLAIVPADQIKMFSEFTQYLPQLFLHQEKFDAGNSFQWVGIYN